MKTIAIEDQSNAFVELLPDICFGISDNKQLKMDILLPKSTKPLPVIIFIKGGGFLEVNKSKYLPQLISFAQKGYVVASIEYRVSSHATFPAQLYDVKTAVRFLRAKSDCYNIDPNRIGVWGNSAGATLSSLLGTTGNVKNLEGNGEWQKYSSEVQAVVNWYGIIDLISMPNNDKDSFVSRLIGGPVNELKDEATKVNPTKYVNKNTPPFLIMHGDIDKVVPFNQSKILYNSLLKANADVTFYKVKKAGHSFSTFSTQTKALQIVQSFFDIKLKTLSDTDND